MDDWTPQSVTTLRSKKPLADHEKNPACHLHPVHQLICILVACISKLCCPLAAIAQLCCPSVWECNLLPTCVFWNAIGRGGKCRCITHPCFSGAPPVYPFKEGGSRIVGCMQFCLLLWNTLDVQCHCLLCFRCTLHQVAPPAYPFQKRWKLGSKGMGRNI